MMPNFLTDTNILLRSVQPAHPMYQEARDAVDTLRLRGEQPCLVVQNIIEFRAVATRPAAVNGLGMSEADADNEIARLKRLFATFDEAHGLLVQWQTLVNTYGAIGKQNHDARIVAAMIVHHIPKIVTFNKDDFTRYPEISVFTPLEILAVP